MQSFHFSDDRAIAEKLLNRFPIKWVGKILPILTSNICALEENLLIGMTPSPKSIFIMGLTKTDVLLFMIWIPGLILLQSNLTPQCACIHWCHVGLIVNNHHDWSTNTSRAWQSRWSRSNFRTTSPVFLLFLTLPWIDTYTHAWFTFDDIFLP